MTRPLDVLVIESRGRAGRPAGQALAEAGHRVHRCYEEGTTEFPCRGLLEHDACPLDAGIDVALLVRPRPDPRPMPHESGVTCALRSGVPVVEAGVHALDPYEPWLHTRVTSVHDLDSVVDACTAAVAAKLDEHCRTVARGLAPLLADAGLAPDSVGCHVDDAGSGADGRAVVHLSVPAGLDEPTRQALAVRAADTFRAATGPHRTTDVVVGDGELPGPC
jgi:hypothetical protein